MIPVSPVSPVSPSESSESSKSSASVGPFWSYFAIIHIGCRCDVSVSFTIISNFSLMLMGKAQNFFVIRDSICKSCDALAEDRVGRQI